MLEICWVTTDYLQARAFGKRKWFAVAYMVKDTPCWHCRRLLPSLLDWRLEIKSIRIAQFGKLSYDQIEPEAYIPQSCRDTSTADIFMLLSYKYTKHQPPHALSCANSTFGPQDRRVHAQYSTSRPREQPLIHPPPYSSLWQYVLENIETSVAKLYPRYTWRRFPSKKHSNIISLPVNHPHNERQPTLSSIQRWCCEAMTRVVRAVLAVRRRHNRLGPIWMHVAKL
jgi:hypothetical protein